MTALSDRRPVSWWLAVPVLVAAAAAGLGLVWRWSTPRDEQTAAPVDGPRSRREQPDDSGYSLVIQLLPPWSDGTSLDQVRAAFHDAGRRHIPLFDRVLARPDLPSRARLEARLSKAVLLLYEGDPQAASDELTRARALVEPSPELAREWLSTVIFLQGMAGQRRGEDENCVECRGESSCIFPIRPAAVHKNPAGTRLAVRHFTEYLHRHPDDLGVRWLLTVACMNLGGRPADVPARFPLPADAFRSEFDIGRFRDIGHLLGVNRYNQAGGAILEDFDNDGLLDLVTTSWDPALPMTCYRNRGDGAFEERGSAAELDGQLGGLYCVQADYNNDGWMDVFVARGAWWRTPIRPSLLRNNGDGTFTDVTAAAGLMHPTNSITAAWADFDNDGLLDLFIANETGPQLLYHNKGDGTFEEIAARAGVAGAGEICKGASWGDFNGDGRPDLFLNCIDRPRLYRNDGDGTFTDVAAAVGITGPRLGFSCWFFDFDNDGWPDLYASAYERSLDDVVRGLLGQPTDREVGRLYRNLGGQRFQDVTREAGLHLVTGAMGSNFADFDNDGFLDFYLGTGEPRLSALVPNRMFKNLAGRRFADITISSGTGHLQKGHAVACGDWDRDGSVDLFVETGGATPADRFHNVFFHNPGQGHNWLTVKLVGVKTNRAAIGARIKAVTAGPEPRTVYRHVTSGSSFGANPLQQTLGLGQAQRLARLEVFWPTSGTTQVFRDLDVDQAIEITEFAPDYRPLRWKRLPVPQ